MTLIPEHIIQEAIEKGGFLNFIGSPTEFDVLEKGVVLWLNGKAHSSYNYEEIILTPAFWQALGKARGWGPPPSVYAGQWVNIAQDFYRLLLSSPTQAQIDAFWNELPNQ